MSYYFENIWDDSEGHSESVGASVADGASGTPTVSDSVAAAGEHVEDPSEPEPPSEEDAAISEDDDVWGPYRSPSPPDPPRPEILKEHKAPKSEIPEGERYALDNPLPEKQAERKTKLQKYTWNKFIEEFEYTHPRQRPPDGRTYHDKIFFSQDFIDSNLKAKFDDFAKLNVKYYARSQGRTPSVQSRPSALNEPIPLHWDIDELEWILFVGLDPAAVPAIIGSADITTINYTHINRLIEYFESHQKIQDIHDFREKQRIKYVGDQAWRILESDNVQWLVHRRIALPWIIPVSIHWHNSKAVLPDQATISEMVQCGRLVGANERIYSTNLLYKAMIPRGIELEAMTVNMDPENQNVWDLFNEGAQFYWYRPAFKIYVWPDEDVGMAMLLGFLKTEVDEADTQTIFVPNKSVVHSIVAEIRPADVSVLDGYGFAYINDYDTSTRQHRERLSRMTKKEKKAYEAKLAADAAKDPNVNIISTNFVGRDNRPGVGNAGYMANCTCGVGYNESMYKYKSNQLRANEFFQLWESRVGFKEKNAINNSTYIYKHTVIRSTQDITAGQIRAWHEAFFAYHSPPIDSLYFFPVEFVYNKMLKPQGTGMVECMCMTRCQIADPEDHSRIQLINYKKMERDQVTIDTAEFADRFTRLTESQQNDVKLYLQQFPDNDIAKERLSSLE